MPRKHKIVRDRSRPGLFSRDGWWNVAIFPAKKGGAKPYRKALNTQDRLAAAEWYDTHAAEIRKRFWRERKGLYVERFWEEACAVYVEEATRIDWGPDAGRLKWLNSKLTGVRLADITYEFWKQITDRKLAENMAKRGKCSGGTLNRYTALVQAVLNKVAKAPRGWIPYEANRFFIYEESEARDVVATLAQAQARFRRLPDWAKDPYLYALATGARRKNVIGLQRPWLNLAERSISIPPRTFKQRKPHKQVLSGVALEIIRRHVGPQASLEGPQEIFLRDGKPITKDMLRHAWDATKTPEDAHLQWRDLRRTWATWCREQGISMEDTQLLGGWLSKSTLERVYSKPSTAFLVGKASELDGVLGEVSADLDAHNKARAG